MALPITSKLVVGINVFRPTNPVEDCTYRDPESTVKSPTSVLIPEMYKFPLVKLFAVTTFNELIPETDKLVPTTDPSVGPKTFPTRLP